MSSGTPSGSVVTMTSSGFVIELALGGTTATLDGEGRTGVAGPDGLHVTGETRVHPRQLGIDVPLVGRVPAVAEWDLWLQEDPP